MELNIYKTKLKIAPTQILVIGFLLLVLIGTSLLSLPIASNSGTSVGIVDSFFTATSAVCVTGLVVVDTGTHWTTFGKTIILILIQIGGLGIMTFSTMFALILGRKITLKERLIMQEALNQFDLQGLVKLTKYIIVTTFCIEAIGAVIFSLAFIPDYGWQKGIAMSIFHSISAFCNAGFDIMGNFGSLTKYIGNYIVNLNAIVIVVLGGLGFTVWIDLYKYIKQKKQHKISLHTKVVIAMTVVLIIFGFIFFLAAEFTNKATIAELPTSTKLISSFFHAVTPRTAGFNTVDINAMSIPSKFMTILLMFIGGSPGSTAGGIKTTTAGLLILTVISVVRGREDTEVFKKRLPKHLVYRALAVILISFSIVILVTMLLSITEKADFMTVLFESTSAFATVGLSMGLTPKLSVIGRLIIALTMFAGRVGPLTLVLALSQKSAKNKGNMKYPEDRIMVG